MYQKLLIPIPACKCSSSSPLQSQMSFCQYLAQVTADGVQPGPGGCSGALFKESDSNTLHNKALTHSELHPLKCPFSQLVLGLCPTHNNLHIRQNQMIRKQKEKYLAHWKESTKNQSKLACYLSLNRDYTVAEYLTTVNDPKQR